MTATAPNGAQAPRVGCILMASGLGRRFGGNKLFALSGGRPLYERALSALPASLFVRAVVTSPYEEILSAGETAGYLPLCNRRAEEGISASIRLGLSALKDTDGALFAVCDQPHLKTDSIITLIDSFLESPEFIYALSWQGKRGNPVLFPRTLYPELLALTGDRGGSAVIRRHPDLLRLSPAGASRELADVDTPQDLHSSVTD